MSINSPKTIPRLSAGFSLIELTVSLLIVVLLAGIALRSTNELSFQVRYEQTQERLNRIKEAIIGNPHRTVNGQPDISGFVADMGRLPNNIHELLEQNFCLDKTETYPACTTAIIQPPYDAYHCTVAGYYSSADCATNAGSWVQNSGGLGVGWRGPYLTVTNNPSKSDAFTDGWGREAQSAGDNNYGWNYDLSGAPDLILQSAGKNQTFNAADTNYDQDYSLNQPYIMARDWLADISGGLNVSFIKPYGAAEKKLPPTISFCTDPTQTDKSTCSLPNVWYGGCDKAGYFNKDSCIDSPPPSSGSWEKCSDGTSTTKTTCESAGKNWYGEGFGCSEQTYTTKAACQSAGKVWRSCTDNGTITDKASCFSHDEIWYGDDLYKISVAPYADKQICMKVFYRKADASIGVLVSDENTANDSPTVKYDPKPIVEDGSFQTQQFAFFRDIASGNLVTLFPIGINAIAIYQYDGASCASSTTLYPDGRTQPTQVLFVPHTNLAAINW